MSGGQKDTGHDSVEGGLAPQAEREVIRGNVSPHKPVLLVTVVLHGNYSF